MGKKRENRLELSESEMLSYRKLEKTVREKANKVIRKHGYSQGFQWLVWLMADVSENMIKPHLGEK